MSKKGKKDASQWVVLVKNKELEADSEYRPKFCKLRNPKTDSGSMYLFSQHDHIVSEVNEFKEAYGSWFIDQTVQQDGGMHLVTEVNPAFLVLPYLIREEKHGKYKPLEQVLIDTDYPECHRLCQCKDLQTLDKMCDVKGSEDLKAYRYNQEKTLAWLKNKVLRLCAGLESEGVVMSGSRSATFVQSAKPPTSPTANDEHIRYAFGLLSDYLPPDLSQQLKTHIGIKDVVKHEKPAIDEPKSKRSKKDQVLTPSEDYSLSSNKGKSSSTAPKLSTAQRSLSKVDKSGMKSISSFFTAKQAKAK